MTNEFSPMMNHYLQTKEQYKDCILLYRLGDFYEMFFEDAEKASRILELTLTGKNCGNNQRAPMCGVPYHAVDTYVAKLLSAGQKVAICEQLTEPGKGRDLVERDVVRVITAGTVMEDTILQDKCNNYVAAVFCDENTGVAFCDITTGEFAVSELTSAETSLKDLQELLVSYKPAEIIANEKAVKLSVSLDCVAAGYVPTFQDKSDLFDVKRAKNTVANHYKVSTLDGFGLRGKSSAIVSASGVLQYLSETQKRELPHLQNPRYIEKSNYMSIDVKTRRNLELSVSARESKRTGSLIWILDKTSTSMGARMLSKWIDRPLQNPTQINARLDGVEELFKNFVLRGDLKNCLANMLDVERLAGKIAYNSLTPKDCNALAFSLAKLPTFKKLLGKAQSKILGKIFAETDTLENACDLLSRAIVDDAPAVVKDGKFIKEGYNAELDGLYDLSHNGRKRISELEAYERERTGIRTLKLGYNKVFGYYFEVSNSFKDAVPSDFIRKQTLTGGERFVSQSLKELEEKILTADERIQRLQSELFADLRERLLEYIPSLQKTANCIATVDALLSLAEVAEANEYTKPKINTKSSELKIVGGRHPIVEAYVKRNNFIGNDTLLDTDENRTMVITGPNMAGKSTYMRQVALITLMAHIGSFVPAESALLPVVDKIFTRVGASDDLAFNQSTFMVEMVEVANILNNATENSLIILDEVGRGTSTFDGLSIAWAVMEYVSQNIRAKTLFATHYHELTELEGHAPGVKNYRVTVKEYNGTVIFLHKIVRGGTNKSFGIEVASLAGVPDVVCERAKQIVAMLESSNGSFSLTNVQNAQENRTANVVSNEVTSVLRDIDMNRLSPIEAFDILLDLVKKVKNNEQN